MVSYALSPPISYASSSPALPLLSPPPPHKKPTISPFYKTILKWTKRHSCPLELPNETPLNQEEQKKDNPSIFIFHDADFPPFGREGSKLSFLVAEEFVDP